MSQIPALLQSAARPNPATVESFPNRETWIVYAWIDYHTVEREKWCNLAKKLIEQKTPMITRCLADAIKISVMKGSSLPVDVYGELLNCAIMRVGWYEVATRVLVDVGYIQ